MPKFRRGGYFFVRWRGDHLPPHVHVYRDRRLVVKWDLVNDRSIKGSAFALVRRLIQELPKEGRL